MGMYPSTAGRSVSDPVSAVWGGTFALGGVLPLNLMGDVQELKLGLMTAVIRLDGIQP
jgi:hypothetical protein